jgi:hypothetical protein
MGYEHVPWLNAKKPGIDPFYWDRFKQLINKQERPPKS